MNFAAANVHIRPMTVDDIDRVLEIQSRLPSAPHWPRLAWIEVLNSSAALRRIALVAALGPRRPESSEDPRPATMGFAVASLLPPQAELEVIAVAEERQRLGLGHRLLAGIISEIKPSGVAEILLEVRASNTAGIGLYRAFGFNEIGIREGYYADPVEDAVLMSLQLQ